MKWLDKLLGRPRFDEFTEFAATILEGRTNQWARSDLRKSFPDEKIDVFFKHRRSILNKCIELGTPVIRAKAEADLAEIAKYEEL